MSGYIFKSFCIEYNLNHVLKEQCFFRFLDSRMMATCSDDTTIALWDIRNLKGHIKLLKGHCNWVKSIEYSAKDNLLVSSGFDGQIYTWDINR